MLVTVLVVMLVGFIVASAVAASTIFAIQTNAGNRSNTQAFIAAESGRDVAAAAIAAGCGATTFSGTDPTYSSTVYVTEGDQPESAASAGVSEGCPTEETRYVVIRSAGTGPDGSTATLDAVYRWQVTSNVVTGSMTYVAGDFNVSMGNYTGDLVLRRGDWGCNTDGTLNGDLYVLEGSVSLSNDCTINGNVWSEGDVTSNSKTVTINGHITTNGGVQISANGGAAIDGSITAKGAVALTNQGSADAQVTGDITSRGTITAESRWTVSGAQTPESISDPVFEPSLDWLRSASRWIDLDNTDWGQPYTETDVCSLSNASIASLVSIDGEPLVLDFTTCDAGTVDVDLSSVIVGRDVVMIAAPSAKLNASVSGLSDDGDAHQVVFVHSDASRAFVDGEPEPSCASNQKDSFSVEGPVGSGLRIMIYTPCGLTGTESSTFAGQYYTNQDSIKLHAGASFECKSMSWPPAFGTLGCTIDGPEGITETVISQQLGSLVYQTER